jgi:hypothetical protein
VTKCQIGFNRHLLIVSIILLVTCSVQSQDYSRYGMIAGIDVDMHDARFAKVGSVGYCCPNDIGSRGGLTMYAGLSTRLLDWQTAPLAPSIDVHLGLQQRSLTSSTAASTFINDPETNQGIQADITYASEYLRTDVILDFLPTFAVARNVDVSLGIRAGYALSSAYTQREELPADLVNQGFYFIDQKSGFRLPYRNLYEGAIPDVRQVMIAANIGITYSIAIDALGTTILTPGLWYRISPQGFGSTLVSREVDPTSGNIIEQPGSWTMQSVGVGLSIRRSSRPTVVLEPCQEIVDGKIVDKTCPKGTILRLNPITSECSCEDTVRVDTTIVTINGVHAYEDGRRSSEFLSEVTVVRFPRENHLPFVRAVFFNQNSSNIDFMNRYLDVSAERKLTFFEEPSFERLYEKHILNIVGYRFTQGQYKRLTLIGLAGANEANGDNLALERAVKTREYLYRRWGIPLSAIAARKATREEREVYRTMLASADGEQAVLVQVNDTQEFLDYVVTDDKFIMVSPTSCFVDATIDLGSRKKAVALDYQMRLGGNTGGRMVQPVRSLFNRGEAGFDRALSQWTVQLFGDSAEIEPSLRLLPVGDGAKLIPLLRVSTNEGQVIEAQRSNSSSVVPIRVQEVQSSGNKVDSAFTIVQLLNVPESNPIYGEQLSKLEGILSQTGVKEGASNVLMPVYDHAQTRIQDLESQYSGLLRDVRKILSRYGINSDNDPSLRISVTKSERTGGFGNGPLLIIKKF